MEKVCSENPVVKKPGFYGWDARPARPGYYPVKQRGKDAAPSHPPNNDPITPAKIAYVNKRTGPVHNK